MLRSVSDVAMNSSAASTSYGTSIVPRRAVLRGYPTHKLFGLGDRSQHPLTLRSRRTQPVRATDDKKSSSAASESDVNASPSSLSADAKASSSPSPDNADAASIAELGTLWESVKRDMKQGMTPEEAQVLESIKIDDLMGDSGDLMRKVADEQIGPLLRSIGISDDPFEFFVDLLRTATAMQLVSAGVLFYGTELLGGYDSGEAFRCVCGLAAGYLSRPFYNVEQLLWPLYDWVLRVVAPGAVYEVDPSPADFQATLSRLGVTVAVCSFLPQLLWGWDNSTTLQFVLPLAAGWVLFDVMYMVALLAKLQK